MQRLIIINFSLILLTTFACNTAKKSYKTAMKKFSHGEYEFAIPKFQNALNKGYSAAKTNFMIAESYRLSNRIYEAESYYKNAIDANIRNESSYFYYGYALKSQEKYKEASARFKEYLEVGTNFDFISRAKKEIRNLKEINRIISKKTYSEATNLAPLNTEAPEYSPYILDDNIVFTSSRGVQKFYAATGTGFTDLYQFEFNYKDKSSGITTPFNETINLFDTHEGSATFSRDGNTMVFARSNDGKKKGRREVDMYITKFISGAWTEPQLLDICKKNAWDSSPSFSPNGKKLYFASNREGGFGGTDIYRATLDRNGNWKNVRNLGSKINTAANEMFPYIDKNGTLYISSDGHPSLGGLDIFKISKDGKKTRVINLGLPFNSSYDDFAIVYDTDTTGYFSSNRPGGKGDDDIYDFMERKPTLKDINFNLIGIVVEESEHGPPLKDVKVTLFDGLENVMKEVITDEKGKFGPIKVDVEKTFMLIAEKEDYFTTRQPFSTIGKTPTINPAKASSLEDVTFYVKIPIDKIVIDRTIVLENIYYDFNKADIRPEAAEDLDELVDLLTDNPDINIELSSHTDSRGEDEYNIDLSQKRADAAIDYLIELGINPSRLIAKGYGETKPIIENAVKEKEHQKNRRTEFKVVEIEE